MSRFEKKVKYNNIDLGNKGGYSKTEFKKMSPAELVASGFSPKAERYKHSNGDAVTKRDYVLLTTGETYAQRKAALAQGVRGLKANAPAKARAEKLRLGALSREQKKAEKSPDKISVRRFKGPPGTLRPVEIIIKNIKPSQVFKKLAGISRDYGKKAKVTILYNYIQPDGAIVTKQSQLSTVENFMDEDYFTEEQDEVEGGYDSAFEANVLTSYTIRVYV